MLRGISSLSSLVSAYKTRDKDPRGFEKARRTFEARNGEIVDSYFTSRLNAASVLVKVNARWSYRRRLLVRYDGQHLTSIEPEFEQVLWRAIWTARQSERESDYLLSARARKVLAEMLHQVTVYLLGTLNALAGDHKPDESTVKEKLAASAAAANNQLDKLDGYAERASVRTAIQMYLFGLPLGALLVAALATALLIADLDIAAGLRNHGLSALLAGGIGSIASVMIRITRGQQLSIDVHQGRGVTLIAGMFRPLIGAVFGVALYVLVLGGIVPLDVPAESVDHFFAGLGFIAGFSERWAQDTIVRSAPISPSPAAIRKDEGTPGSSNADDTD
jgi:hypothetical protein